MRARPVPPTREHTTLPNHIWHKLYNKRYAWFSRSKLCQLLKWHSLALYDWAKVDQGDSQNLLSEKLVWQWERCGINLNFYLKKIKLPVRNIWIGMICLSELPPLLTKHMYRKIGFSLSLSSFQMFLPLRWPDTSYIALKKTCLLSWSRCRRRNLGRNRFSEE